MKNLIRSKKFKNFLSKFYSWGIMFSIIGGLLFLYQCSTTGIVFITIGGCMLILFLWFSAFTPPRIEPDWSLVFPELAGVNNPEEKSSLHQRVIISELKDEVEKLKKEIEKLKK